MTTTWATVAYDVKTEDQVQSTLADDGSITNQITINWVAVTDGTGRGTTVEALTASAGGNTMPAIGSIIAMGGQPFTVRQVLPRRTGPYSFNVQIQAQTKYSPPQSGKSNITIRFSGQPYTQDAHYDSTGTLIVNSAGQAFDPAPSMTVYDERIEVSYTTTTDQSAAFAGVRGKVCNGTLTFNIRGCNRSYGHRGLKCEDVQQSEAPPQQDGTIVYSVTASFTARSDGFIDRILDSGKYQLVTTTSPPSVRPIKDADKNNVSEPVPLDGTGQPLALPTTTTTAYTTPGPTSAVDANTKRPAISSGHWLAFYMEAEADFTPVFTGLS